MIVILMGVAGSGKTTVGTELSHRLGWRFLEGDMFHSDQNKKKMESGVPLTDDDRWPWLKSMAAALAEIDRSGEDAILACSALRRVYRDRLRTGSPDILFVHLQGPKRLIAQRMQSRTGHYMPLSLLESQLETLEPPDPNEAALTLDLSEPVAELTDRILGEIGQRLPSHDVN